MIGQILCKLAVWRTKFSCDSPVLLSFLGCVLLASPTVLEAKDAGEHWVGTWATAPMKYVPPPQAGPAPDLAGSTLRQIVHVSVGGKRVRVKFSNAFGGTPLKIGSVPVALSVGAGAIKPDTEKPGTFNGQASAVVPAGAPLVSDPVELAVPA